MCISTWIWLYFLASLLGYVLTACEAVICNKQNLGSTTVSWGNGDASNSLPSAKHSWTEQGRNRLRGWILCTSVLCSASGHERALFLGPFLSALGLSFLIFVRRLFCVAFLDVLSCIRRVCILTFIVNFYILVVKLLSYPGKKVCLICRIRVIWFASA